MKIETREIELFLETKYNDSRKFAYFTELRLGIGGEHEQRVDGFLMELWQSTNYSVTTFEFKTARQDFLNEVKKPSKMKQAFELSNRFIFVTANDIVKDELEIPRGCGWWIFDGKEIIEKIKPTMKPKPEFAPWPLIASIMRRSFRVRDTHALRIKNYLKSFEELGDL